MAERSKSLQRMGAYMGETGFIYIYMCIKIKNKNKKYTTVCIVFMVLWF